MGVAIEISHTFKAEQVQVDGGRADLEAVAADGRPLVKIEAKLMARLVGEQPKSYCEDLHVRSGGGLLLVLVPRYRAVEAAGMPVVSSRWQAMVHGTFGTVLAASWRWLPGKRVARRLQPDHAPKCRCHTTRIGGIERRHRCAEPDGRMATASNQAGTARME